ncbi:unnamed protein product [Paramecium pentaurelia]|uniref:Uncharacterized protein n=1 Tax=Paramecium pentaurelia TaxID=43138 RepID=A0A8S1X5Z4_9CILI|nr:unnamed protein product [Paramecium pentaurelia]
MIKGAWKSIGVKNIYILLIRSLIIQISPVPRDLTKIWCIIILNRTDNFRIINFFYNIFIGLGFFICGLSDHFGFYSIMILLINNSSRYSLGPNWFQLLSKHSVILFMIPSSLSFSELNLDFPRKSMSRNRFERWSSYSECKVSYSLWEYPPQVMCQLVRVPFRVLWTISPGNMIFNFLNQFIVKFRVKNQCGFHINWMRQIVKTDKILMMNVLIKYLYKWIYIKPNI